MEFCDVFQGSYVIGELDTFKRVACLLVAINRVNLSKDKRINASIALDTAYKMCEKPYWNVGENFDVPKKIEEVNFKECFEKDMYTYNHSKNMLIDSLVYENGEPISYYLNLELFYRVAVELKKDQLKASIDNINNLSDYVVEEPKTVEHINNSDASTTKKKRKHFSIFRKQKLCHIYFVSNEGGGSLFLFETRKN